MGLEATTFLTMIPYGLAFAATLFLADVKRSSEEKPSIRESFRAIFRNRRFIVFVVSAALVTETVQSVTVFLNQPQYLRSGIGITYFGPLLVLMQVIRLITVKSYVLSNRFGRLRAVIGLFSLILIAIAGLVFTASPVVSILLIGLIGGSMALAEPMIIDEQNSSVTISDRATVLSVYSMCGGMLSASINPFIGLEADTSIQLGLSICAAVCAAAVALLVIYTRSHRRLPADN